MNRLPGLVEEGRWDIPARLNMARQCLDKPADRVAVIDLTGDVRADVTYGRLGEMVDGLARALMRRVVAGDLVGVLLSQSPWCLAAHLATWKIGAISVSLFKLFKHDALALRIGDSGLELVLTDVEGAQLVGDLAQPLLANKIGKRGAELAFADTGPEDPSVLIYTSGITGSPKGALHGHRTLTGHLLGVVTSHDYLRQEGDCLWTPADWAWIGGLFDVAMPALALGVPVVAARMAKFDVDECERIIAQGAVRNVFFPPTALRMLKAADARIEGLRSVASGGEPLGAQMLDWGRGALGVTINEFYGQTEANMVSSSCGAAFAARAGCIGKPVAGFEIAVLDGDQPTDGEGDIAVRRGAASMMLGYWQRPEETAAKYRGDWMLTGDRGVWEGDFLRFVGREDDVITSSGYRIGHSEIEDCLLTHAAVATCGVVGKPDALRTEVVKAYVVVKDGAQVSAEELKNWIKERLASYSYPREIEFLEALPMTVTGKVIRRELKARAVGEL